MLSICRQYRLVIPAIRAGVVLLAFLILFSTAARAQSLQLASPQAKANDPLLFPTDFLRGYIDFAVAPPHNEPDLGRCNHFGPRCTAFARYVLSGYLEFQPFARTPLRHLFVFFEPRAWFGNNIPQIEYTAAATPLALENIFGLGIELPKNFELRVTGHHVYGFGRYSHQLGPTDSGTDSPLGLYNTVSVRWYFGGYGRRTHSW